MKVKRLIPLVLAALLLGNWFTESARADAVPYESYSVDSQGRLIAMNPAYLPVRAIGTDLPRTPEGKSDTLKNPEDVFIDGKDRIFIADRGNDRIVELDNEGYFVRFWGIEAGKGKLKAPEGIFAAADGSLYVADTGNSRIVKYAADGGFIREFTSPDSEFLPKSYRYVPSKLVVDNRDILFVVSKGSFQGMLQLSQDNEFLGFYGKNKVQMSVVERMQRIFYTKEQQARLSDVLPGSITNVTVNHEGFLYTTTVSTGTEQLKKLNFSGQNILQEKSFKVPRRMASGLTSKEYLFRDAAVDANGMLTAIDQKTNTILQYDPQGKLLFTFAGTNNSAPKLGTFRSPTGIALTSSGDVVVTDNATHIVHLLRPTAFTSLVLEATKLYMDGKYQESEEPWKRVLELNEFYDRAHLGLAKAYYKKGLWQEAMEEFKLAADGTGYSDAYWQVRMIWLQEHFNGIMAAILVMAAAWTSYRRWGRTRLAGRWGITAELPGARLGRQCREAWRVLRQPILVFEELRDSKNASWSVVILLLILAAVCRLGQIMLTGFVFRPVPLNLIDPVRSLAILLIPLFSWMICNYLVSTLYRGEGSFKTVCAGTLYALAPYLAISLPLALLSNLLTNGEGVLYHFGNTLMLGWTLWLLFLKVQTIHNYELTEAVLNVVLTIFTMLLLWFAVFVQAGLTFELRDFVQKLTEELIYRG